MGHVNCLQVRRHPAAGRRSSERTNARCYWSSLRQGCGTPGGYGPFEVSHGRTCPFSAARRTSSGVNGVSGSPGRTLRARRKLALAERNQQVAMTPDESLSPLYSPLYSPFVRILPLFTTISIAFL